MALQSDLLRLIFESTSAGLILCNADGYCVAANAASAALLGIEADNNPSGASLEILLGPLPTGTVEWALRRERPDGDEVWLGCRISPPLGDGKHFVVTLSDISEQKRDRQELLHCTTWDPVSGLPGRIPLLERLTQSIGHRAQPAAAGRAAAGSRPISAHRYRVRPSHHGKPAALGGRSTPCHRAARGYPGDNGCRPIRPADATDAG